MATQSNASASLPRMRSPPPIELRSARETSAKGRRPGDRLPRFLGEVSLALEPDDDFLDRLLGRELGGVEDELGVAGLLVRIRHAGEGLDLARPRFRVETLHVARLADFERCCDPDFEE